MLEHSDKTSADETRAASSKPTEPGKASPHQETAPNPFRKDVGMDRTQTVSPPFGSAASASGIKKQLKISCHKCLQKLDLTYLEPFSRFNCPSCGVELIVPRWFDNYLLEEPGGIGGMATVYRTLDLALDREVAIKVLNPAVASRANSTELFLHEARTAATINHHAVIPIYTCGIFEGQPYIVMQYMGGGSLESRIKESVGAIPLKASARWIRDISDGLENARRRGITHHDIKPGNIMLDVDGNAKIGDFGLAYAVNDSRSSKMAELTRSWISPHYVSPERLRDGQEDYKGDIYSLGATFYHLVTGSTPFQSEDVKSLLQQRLEFDTQPAHMIRQDLPKELSSLIEAMMCRIPEKRPDYTEISKTLSDYVKLCEIKSRPAAKDIETSIDLIPCPASTPAGSQPKPSILPPSWLFAATAILLLIASFAFLDWRDGLLGRHKVAIGTAASAAVAAKPDLDRLPEVSRAFAEGDLAPAMKLADKAFSDVRAPTEQRLQAALQLAFAYCLAKDPKASESCSFIAERLEAICAASSAAASSAAASSPRSDNPSTTIVKYLASFDSKDSALRESMYGMPQSLRLASAMAIFIRTARSNAPQESVVAALTQLRSESSAAPRELWSNAWQGRLELWSRCLESVPPGSAVEPLIAALPDQLKAAAKLVKSRQLAAEQAKASELTVKFREGAIVSATPAKSAVQRPMPSGMKFDKQALDSYLSALPDKARQGEAARASAAASAMENINGKMRQLDLRLRFESFEGGGSELGRGVLLLTKGGALAFRPEGQQPQHLQWSDLSPRQLAAVAQAFARELERFALAESSAEAKDALARQALDAAALAAWLGEPKAAAKCASIALKIDPENESEAEGLLLK